MVEVSTAVPTARRSVPAFRRRDGVGRADRLLRNGRLLTASSLIASSLGAGYWVLATRWFSPATVGRNYAAVSAMMFIAGLGQLNLANTLVRFVPAAGRRTSRLVGRVYLASASVTLALAAAFVLAVPQFSPQLDFLRTPAIGGAFVAATAGYAVFVIQDGALTGLRRADWVMFENALFAVAKIGFIALFASTAMASGILWSWYAALALSLVVTNRFLFAHAIPRHAAEGTSSHADPSRPTLGYLAADFTGAMCWLAAITLPPIFVLDRLGADQSAYFSLAWVVSYALYQLSANMGSSLVVEAANDPVRLAANCRRVLRHTGLLLAGFVGVLTIAAPYLLSVFGPGYARYGTGLLRLLLLSSLPNLVVSTVVSVCRARRRLIPAVCVLVTVCGIAVGLTVALLPVVGIEGAGIGWLSAQCLVAAVLLVRRSWWLGTGSNGAGSSDITSNATESNGTASIGTGSIGTGPKRPASRPSVPDLANFLVRRAAAAAIWPADRVTAFRLVRAHGANRVGADTGRAVLRAARTTSDLLIVRAAQGGGIVIKCPRAEEARRVLGRQYDVLEHIAADDRLGEWRELLPGVVTRDLAARPPRGVESCLPGVTGSALLRERPRQARVLAATALAAIRELHEVTGRIEQVGPAQLARWVDEPLAAVERGLRPYRCDAFIAGLGRLRDRVHGGLSGYRLRVGWVHRDFHPGNVLYEDDGARVTGIVDWGGAVPDGPTDLDAKLFALALDHETCGRPIGDLVAERVEPGAADPDEALLLVTWLWHVTDNIEKSARFRRNRLWVRNNVLAVLKAMEA